LPMDDPDKAKEGKGGVKGDLIWGREGGMPSGKRGGKGSSAATQARRHAHVLGNHWLTFPKAIEGEKREGVLWNWGRRGEKGMR